MARASSVVLNSNIVLTASTNTLLECTDGYVESTIHLAGINSMGMAELPKGDRKVEFALYSRGLVDCLVESNILMQSQVCLKRQLVDVMTDNRPYTPSAIVSRNSSMKCWTEYGKRKVV